MSLSNSEKTLLDKTKFGSEGEIKDLQIPSSDIYEICFDGRYDKSPFIYIIYIMNIISI